MIVKQEFNAVQSFGVGVFETMPCFDGVIPLLNEHIERLYKGIQLLNFDAPVIQTAEIMQLVKQTVPSGKGVVRLVQRRGEETELYVSNHFPYSNIKYLEGMKLTLATGKRNEHSPYIRIKTLNYLENLLERERARSHGYDDALFLNTAGNISETSTGNIFIIKDDTIFTPNIESGLLPGIIRSHIIDKADELGLGICEKKLILDDVYAAENVFVTNSLLGIMPVSQIDNHAFSTLPHPLMRILDNSLIKLGYKTKL